VLCCVVQVGPVGADAADGGEPDDGGAGGGGTRPAAGRHIPLRHPEQRRQHTPSTTATDGGM